MDGQRIDIGARVKMWRRAAGLSQRGLAERVGVSHTAISKVERGELTPSSDTLLSIARALDVRVAQLLKPAPTIKVEVLGSCCPYPYATGE